MRVQLYNVVLFLAEMKRFELLRRFEPTYRISSADPSTAWVHLQTSLTGRNAVPRGLFIVARAAGKVKYFVGTVDTSGRERVQ